MSEVKDKDYYDGEYEDDYDYVVCIFCKGDVEGDVDKIWHDVGDNLEADDDGNIRHGVKGNARGNVMGSW